MNRFFTQWIIPFLLASLAFVLVQPTLAQIAESEAQLAEALVDGEVEIGEEAGKSGFRQIYYVWQGKKHFITSANYTSANPVIDGEYVAWMAQIDSGWRIFLYHVPTDTTTQLTQAGIHTNPRINGNKVVWEGQDKGVWQIFLFDGVRTLKITSGDMAVNPDINGDRIVFARKNAHGEWRAEQYTISNKDLKVIREGNDAQHPSFKDGQLVFGLKTAVQPEIPVSVSPSPTQPSEAPSTSPVETDPIPTPLASPTDPPIVSEEEIREEQTTSPSPLPSPTPVTEEDIKEELAVSPTPEASVSPSPEITSDTES